MHELLIILYTLALQVLFNHHQPAPASLLLLLLLLIVALPLQQLRHELQLQLFLLHVLFPRELPQHSYLLVQVLLEVEVVVRRHLYLHVVVV